MSRDDTSAGSRFFGNASGDASEGVRRDGGIQGGESLVDTVREALLVLSTDLRVESANQFFYEQFQVTPEETIGHTVYDLGNGQWDTPELRGLLEEILPREEAFEGYEVAHDFEEIGRRVMLLNARRVESHQLVLLAIEDVTERAHAEKRQAYLLRLADALRPLAAPSEIEAAACRLLGEHLGANRAYYVEVDEADDRARVQQDYVRDDASSLAGTHRVSEYGWMIQPVREGKTIVVEDVRHEEIIPEADREAMAALSIAAHVNTPLVKEGTLIGALCVTEAEPRTWTEFEVELVRDTAARIWAAIERAYTEGKLRQLNEELEVRVEERTQALRASEARYRALTETQPNLVWEADSSGALIFSNARFSEYTGQSCEQRHGEGMWTGMFHPEDRVRSLEAWQKAVETGEMYKVEHRLRRADGAYRWFLSRALPVCKENGGDRYWIGTCTDIHDRKDAERRLADLNGTLECRVRERTEQVRDLSSRLTRAEQEERHRISQILHDDLQQLLYGIEMETDSLQKAVEEAGRSDWAGRLSQVQTWLGRALETTRQLTVDLSPPVLEGEGLAAALEWLQSQMSKLHGLEVRLEVRLEADRAWPIQEDLRVLLFQIVRELLFNVKKHAGTDLATVRLAEEAGHLVVYVIDEGCGFDVDAVAEEEDRTGSGFGLFNARERLKLLGGRLHVHSEPGQGTRVEMLAPHESREPAKKEEPPDSE